ncbi:MAG TPA: hypothetical protein PK200_13685 [Spirochaetota bacterium]|nr:hypothetical protein [Spirochaetota bacterium]
MNPVSIIKEKTIVTKEKIQLVVMENYRIAVQKVREAWTEAMKDENSHYLAAAGYIPFIGWLVPVYLKEDDAFCQEHGKTAFYMALIVLVAVTTLMLVNLFTTRDYRVIRLIIVISIYLIYLAYFLFISYGMYTSLHRKNFEIPDTIAAWNKLRTIIEL